MTTIDRVKKQYQENPLARTLVYTLCEQIGITPTTGSTLMILAHEDLLSMLELGDAQLQEKIAQAHREGPAPFLSEPPVEPKQIWLPR